MAKTIKKSTAPKVPKMPMEPMPMPSEMKAMQKKMKKGM